MREVAGLVTVDCHWRMSSWSLSRDQLAMRTMHSRQPGCQDMAPQTNFYKGFNYGQCQFYGIEPYTRVFISGLSS